MILVLGTDPMQSSPILDLRIRKAIRRNGARLAVATERPTALDGGAEAIARYAPGQASYFLGELAAAVGGGRERRDAAGPRPCATPARSSSSGASGSAPRRPELLDLAAALDVVAETAYTDMAHKRLRASGSPGGANAAGCARRACLPDTGPGLPATRRRGRGTEEIRQALIDGELDGLILVGVDPLRDFADTARLEGGPRRSRARRRLLDLHHRDRRQGRCPLPARDPRRKDGTVTHPDGRLQRVRPAAGRPGDIRPGWQTLADLS